MADSGNKTGGIFSAPDFARRVESFALPLQAAATFHNFDEIERGDHDLNPELMHPVMDLSGLRPAAVLIGVVDRPAGATVLLTQRAATLSHHAGQISFPGGRVDKGDQSVINTAIREANEEISLNPQDVTPIGLLDPYRTRTGFRILPVLSLVSPDIRLQADEREVADIFEVPLEFLMTAANHRYYSVDLEGKPRQFHAMPYGERYIWGATAGILRIMYERLYQE